MPLGHIVILGAGPAGLAAALAFSQLSSTSSHPLCITVLELRPQITTLGGSINLTPLALRYLDRLGVGTAVRGCGVPVSAIEMLSLRSGKLLGRLWPGVDALRVKRHDLVTGMLETARVVPGVSVRFGVKAVNIHQTNETENSHQSQDTQGGGADDGGKVILTLDSGEEISADVLLACDGLHSLVRRTVVDPDRRTVYSGKATVCGFTTPRNPGDTGLTTADGRPAVVDTSLLSGRYGSLLITFCEPARNEIFLAAVVNLPDTNTDNVGKGGEAKDTRDGWRASSQDRSHSVDEWSIYPVYHLPAGGKWFKGRVLLLGDAAHAMPPQGESTGIAIEDGVLIAHVFQRHTTRSVAQMFHDYERLRRGTIDRLYRETVSRWAGAVQNDGGWFMTIVMEFLTVIVLALMNMRKRADFAGDVGKLKLPP
ncbi:FAD/NAD(P)-binding domain-containing protein [Diplogelasinospora grovesii]|uniref:FAD/NAD(P)-binding domain-containing protein n=1 Tax=Diplogelasinospora grovesii TaxID=303347 RepID=A0AAN6NFN8_9PEZI|nr:FAD/NAD(P)-binding domain-containing protein [Diplogelasinospora grovesii]